MQMVVVDLMAQTIQWKCTLLILS